MARCRRVLRRRSHGGTGARLDFPLYTCIARSGKRNLPKTTSCKVALCRREAIADHMETAAFLNSPPPPSFDLVTLHLGVSWTERSPDIENMYLMHPLSGQNVSRS